MLIIPAIDIKNGNCVRLLQGDPDKETVYSDDPVKMALKFQEMGAELVHVVDLDGAFSGKTVNRDLVVRISHTVKVPIEIGGGIRTADAAKNYIDSGIKRIILGTVVLEDEFQNLIKKFSGNIVAGIDARDSLVATHGWKNVSEVHAVDFIKKLMDLNVTEIIYTDIKTDGMLKGPNIRAIEEILTKCPGISLIASGGVSSIDDIKNLSEYSSSGLKGCIVGKAIYDGRLDLKEAIRLFID
jgi:phosphoribosylformimino-5-aminoimidazole carboxamide ribotide isomerase